MKARIKSEAQILSTAMETGDYETAASRLPAELLDKSGGIAGLKQSDDASQVYIHKWFPPTEDSGCFFGSKGGFVYLCHCEYQHEGCLWSRYCDC